MDSLVRIEPFQALMPTPPGIFFFCALCPAPLARFLAVVAGAPISFTLTASFGAAYRRLDLESGSVTGLLTIRKEMSKKFGSA